MQTPTRNPLSQTVNVRMSPADREKLALLAKTTSRSEGGVLRFLIRSSQVSGTGLALTSPENP